MEMASYGVDEAGLVRATSWLDEGVPYRLAIKFDSQPNCQHLEEHSIISKFGARLPGIASFDDGSDASLCTVGHAPLHTYSR